MKSIKTDSVKAAQWRRKDSLQQTELKPSDTHMNKYEPQTKPHTSYKRITEIRRKCQLSNTRENLCDRRLGRVLRCGAKTAIHKRKTWKGALHPLTPLLLCRSRFKEQHEKNAKFGGGGILTDPYLIKGLFPEDS